MPFGFRRGTVKGVCNGRGQGRFGSGNPPTNCICPKCGKVVAHVRGVPCFKSKCPQCNSPMARQFFNEDKLS